LFPPRYLPSLTSDAVVVAGGAGEEVEDEHQHREETDQGGVNQS